MHLYEDMQMATAKYKDLLIETTIITHTGSGPVDPAPKEKETKSPVEDGTGQGTKQAATGHPNVIPPIAYLKKELAKEGIGLHEITGRELLELIKTSSPLSRAAAHVAGAIHTRKSIDPGIRKYLDKKKDILTRRKQGRRVRRTAGREQGKEYHYQKNNMKEQRELDKITGEELVELIKTTPLLKRVFADPKYKARRDDVLGARGIPPATRKAGKKLSANIASARKDVSNLKQKRKSGSLDKKFGGSFQTLDSLKKAKFEAIEFALESCGMDEEELQELTKTRKLSTRISKTLHDPTYRDRKKSLLALRKRNPQERKAQSQQFDKEWNKSDARNKRATRKFDYMDDPQSKRDLAAKGGGWDKTRRQRDREKEKTIMKGYRADKKKRPYLAGARPGGIRHKV